MLETIGLTPAEARAYRDLVGRGALTRAALCAVWDWCDTGELEMLLAGLEAKGLLTRFPGPPVKVAAAAPDVALEGLLLAREEQLRRARQEIEKLAASYRQTPSGDDPTELVETITGLDAVLQRWEQLQRGARHEVRGFDRPPYGRSRNLLELELLARGIGYRSLYERDSLEGRLDHVEALVAAGEQARVAPSLPMKLVLVDDRYGLVPLRARHGPESVVVIHASPLLEALSRLFEIFWERSVPLRPGAVPDPVEPAPSSQEARLVSLLAAGVTDAAIARQLGWSPRTMYRRLRQLLGRLDATTRFQAGVQASKRGWL